MKGGDARGKSVAEMYPVRIPLGQRQNESRRYENCSGTRGGTAEEFSHLSCCLIRSRASCGWILGVEFRFTIFDFLWVFGLLFGAILNVGILFIVIVCLLEVISLAM